MSTGYPAKVSAARRKGDAYEETLLARECLRMLDDPSILSVRHEPAEFDPAGDVVVEARDEIAAFQAKHAVSPNALLDLDDLLTDPQRVKLTIERLWRTWERFANSQKRIFLRVFSNRAAGPKLAKLLDEDAFATSFIDGEKQKTAYRKLRSAVGNPPDERFRRFLSSIRFDLRQPSLNELRAQVRAENIERRFGLPPVAATAFFERVQAWYEAKHSAPITREKVLDALPIDRSTLPQTFPVDLKTLIDRADAVNDVIATLDRHADGYVALVGPPGSGKSTLLTRIHEELRRQGRPVVRYYGFVRLTDPDAARRVTKDEFVKSIIEQLYASYGDRLAGGQRYDYSAHRLLHLLTELGTHFLKEGKHLVLIVDGLDHVFRARSVEESQKLYAVLPDVLPSGVRCILGAQSMVYAPKTIQLTCGADRTFTVPPFTDAQAQEYLRRYAPLRQQLSEAQIAAAARRGEGFPLYLRYIAERLLEVDAADADRAIDEMPAYAGDIDAYYAVLWSDAKDMAFVKTCGVLARLQFAAQPDELPRLTGLDAFDTARTYAQVRHLLLVSPAGCRIFHNSFREFVVAQLSDVELHALDVRVYEFLRTAKQGTRAWFEHIVTAARLAGEAAFAYEVVDESFVDGAIGAGVPASRVKRMIRDALGAAAGAAEAVHVARLASLSNNTNLQLSTHLDGPQLIRTLLALGDAEAALVRTTDALDGRSISEVADVLIALARLDRRDVARDVARTFLRNLPAASELKSVDDITQVARVVAAYSRRPAEYLAHTILRLRNHEAIAEGTTSGLLLVPELVSLLSDRKDARSLAEITTTLERFDGDAQDVREAWRVEVAVAAARRAETPEAAAALLRVAASGLRDERVVRLAGEAALLGCSTDDVRALLGERTFLPPTDNDAFMHRGRPLAMYVRTYAAALVGAEREEEFHTIDTYLRDAGSWLAVYWRAVSDTMRANVLSKRNLLADADAFLAPLDLLISHRRPENERLFEVFPPIRRDVPGLLRDVIHGFMAAGGRSDELVERLARWGSSELITFQFGLGLAINDYSSELDAVAIAAEFPLLHDQLKPLMDVIHEKIAENVLATYERSSQLLRAAEIAARIGLTARARTWRDEGVRAARGYGVRKDHTLDTLIDAAAIADTVDHDGTPVRLADLLTWCRWMAHVTDGKGTKWFFHYAFSLALQHDFRLAANLVRTYAQAVGKWRYSASLADLLQRGDGEQPYLAYVLAECIDECTWDEGAGLRERFNARLAIFRAAKSRSEKDAAEWVLRHLRQSFIEEVPPELRAELQADLDAAVNGELPPPRAAAAAARIGVTPSMQVVEIDGSTYTPEKLRAEAAASLDNYVRLHDALDTAGKLYVASVTLRSAREQLVQSAGDAAALDEVVAAIGSRLWVDSAEEYAEIAARYAALGARDKQHEMLQRAFAAIHGWGLHDKKLDYILPLIDDDPDRVLGFLLNHIAEQVEEHGYAFGAATLLVRALQHFPPSHQKLIGKIYDAFHDSVGALFRSLPQMPDDPFAWLRATPLTLDNFENIAFGLIFHEWRQPALHRRTGLTHLLCDLALVAPDRTLPRVVALLAGPDVTLQMQAALLLDAVVLRAPELVEPYRTEIHGASAAIHDAATRYHLSRVHTAIGVATPAIVKQATPTIDVPSGALQPSPAYADILKRVLKPIRARVRYAANGLGIDLKEVDWRIERQMLAAGFDAEAAREAEKEEWDEFSSPSERDVVPFESTTSRAFYHAAAHVFDEITGGEAADGPTRGALAQLFRLYDAALPHRSSASKPADLRIREARDASGDADPWLAFDGVVPSEWITATDEALVLYDAYSHGTREWSESGFRISCLVDAASASAIADGTLQVAPDGYIEVLAATDDERTTTIEEAQHALLRPYKAGLDRGTRSAIAIQGGTWWHALPTHLASLARELVHRYGLAFESPFAMHLHHAGNRAVFAGRWADGVRARHGSYQPLGSGYRLTIEPTFLRRMRDDGFAFLCTESLTRRRFDRFTHKPTGMRRLYRTIVVG